MQSHSNYYAIEEKFKTLKDENKELLLSLTKILMEKNFNFLSISSNLEYFQNDPLVLQPEQYHVISQIYQQYELFDELEKITKKTTEIMKINKKLKKYVEDDVVTERLRKTLNAIILLNLIKKQLKNKSKEHIDNFNLFVKLSNISTNLPKQLNLTQLLNLSTNEQINDFVKNIYKYHNNVFVIDYLSQIDDAEYAKIYNLFFLFV